MDIENIFKEINKIQLGNIMRHFELVQYFDFLNLGGYAEMQKQACLEETERSIELHKWYTKHHNKLIRNEFQPQTSIIPSNWYPHVRNDVSANDKKNAVNSAFKQWCSWEKEAHTKFSGFYKDLIAQNALCEAEYLKNLIFDVEEEIEEIESILLNLNNVSFDLNYIFSQQ